MSMATTTTINSLQGETSPHSSSSSSNSKAISRRRRGFRRLRDPLRLASSSSGWPSCRLPQRWQSLHPQRGKPRSSRILPHSCRYLPSPPRPAEGRGITRMHSNSSMLFIVVCVRCNRQHFAMRHRLLSRPLRPAVPRSLLCLLLIATPHRNPIAARLCPFHHPHRTAT